MDMRRCVKRRIVLNLKDSKSIRYFMKLYIRNCKQTLKGCFTWGLKRAVGPYQRQRKWLEQTQWYSAEELESLQLKLLKELITHAYETVPFYRNIMNEAGFDPSGICSLEDIQRFPILSKEDIRAAGDTIYSTKYPSLLTRTAYTGGTTGLRLPLMRDIGSIGNEHAFVRRLFTWAGLRESDPCAFLIARKVCPQNQKEPHPYAYDAMLKELTLSVFHVSASNARVFIEALRRYRIKALIGYPSAISTLARYSLFENDSIQLKAVLTTSETLEPSRKEIISKAFGCRVFDYYGGGERVCYIHTCSEGRYHLVAEYGLTEFMDIPGQPGVKKIIATGFWNWAMPLIRYDTGDIVQLSDSGCTCGRHYPCIERIIGRQGQSIITPSGREIGPTALEAIMENILFDMKGLPVAEAQMVQEDAMKLVLEYVPLEQFKHNDEKAIAELIQKYFPDDFQIQARAVKQIQRTVSGKALSLILQRKPAQTSQSK